MNKYAAFIAFYLLLSVSAFAGNDTVTVDKIIGVVGDKIVLYSDLEAAYLSQKEQLKDDVPPNLKCYLLDQLMLQNLLISQAGIDSLQVGEEEIEAKLDQNIRYYISLFGSQDAFEKYYKKTVLQMKAEFRDGVKDNLLAERMQDQIVSGVQVTPSEVKSFFRSIPKDSLPFFNAEVELKELVINAKVSDEQKQIAYNKIEGLLKQVKEGGDFAALATEHSDDKASAVQGGELGFIGRGQLVPEYEAVAYKLLPGEISKIIETQYGYHIVQLIERRGNTMNSRHILIKPQMGMAEEVAAQLQVEKVRRLLKEDSLTFDEAVKKYSNDEQSKTNGGILLNPQTGSTKIDVDLLDPNTFFAIDTLEPGEISQPISFTFPTGETGYKLLQLNSYKPPHQANLADDYDRLQQVTLNNKKQKTIQQWISKSRNKSYVHIEDEYKSCDLMDKWLPNK